MVEKGKKRVIVLIAVIVLLLIFIVYIVYLQVKPIKIEYVRGEMGNYVTIYFGSSRIVFPTDLKSSGGG